MTRMNRRRRALGSDRLVAALDVGTTKVCCIVAEVDKDDGINVLGMGYRVSGGVRAGAVVDMDQTESAIRAAVDQAERVADQTIDEVIVNLSAGSPLSRIVEMDVAIDGYQVSQADVDGLVKAAAGQIAAEDREIVHAFPACYSIDGAIGVSEPAGMFGDRLSVALHVLTAAQGPVRNLEACVERAHLGAMRKVISPYASGLATLVDDEIELGAACVDMGGGTTTISIFARGAMVHADIIPMGGRDITEAIARELLTPLDEAERLKTLHGSAMASRSDEEEFIDVPQMGENEFGDDGVNRVPRAALTGTIQGQMEKTLDAVREKLASSGFDGVSGHRVVLTGGASQLTGTRELAQQVLGKQVRIGRPRGIIGLPDSAAGPAFSTCAGLLVYAVRAPLEVGEAGMPAHFPLPEAGGFQRMGRWLRENL